MPVMLPSWVDYCWTQGLDSYVCALDSTIVSHKKCCCSIRKTPAHFSREMRTITSLSPSLSFPLSLTLSLHVPLLPLPPTSQLKAHSCPPFTGCTVTVTGLEERERRKVRELVEGNGGVYSGELTKDVCTHLLVGSTTSMLYVYILHIQNDTECLTRLIDDHCFRLVSSHQYMYM